AGEPDAEKPREEEINGVRVVRWPTWSPGGAYHLPRRQRELEKLLAELVRNADVVHVHSVHSILSMQSLEALKGRAPKIVVTPYYHGTGHTAFRRLLWVPWRRHVRKLLEGCVVHTVSKLEAKLVERDFHLQAMPIENGVEEWIKNIKWEPQGYVLYSGRIEEYKNIHLLAQLVKMLNELYNLDLQLKVYGRGSYKDELAKVLKEIGVKHELGDFKPFEEYIEVLSHASLFGLLSEKESYPQSVNEANAIGVPALVSKPWGENYEGRTRTQIVDITKRLSEITEEVYKFMEKAPREPPSNVPTWSEVAKEYINRLYMG
ncbi:MAG: glycosyltransferase family 4 protein, partial [Thaumarchaeota archaeon]|nr:glycosyltransferase family 4 protein [Candidatus Terraquivivens yellowstonensis]